MSWCLTKEAEAALMDALKKDGDPQKMIDRESEGRLAFFAKHVGEENAHNLNTLFESKMLLKSQQKGFESFVKNMGGSKQIRTDFLSKVGRLDKALTKAEVDQYLGDFVSKRLGLEAVSEKQFKTVSDLAKKAEDTKTSIPESSPARSPERLAHGFAVADLEKYVNQLKLQASKPSFKSYLNPVKLINSGAGLLKSTVSSFDNSYWGRQGMKALLNPRTTHIWAKNFAKSWVDIGKELAGHDAMDFINADKYSRPNALNGKYKAGGYGLDVLSEEAFPSHFLAHIPILSRFYKAAESAFNGGAIRMRMDLADKFIKVAEKQGINTLDSREAQGIGTLVRSMTGRGSLGKLEPISKEANLLLFSIKFLKSNIDTLTLHALDSKATKFTRVEAGKNLLGMIGSLAGIYTIASGLNPGNVELDNHSSNFGKIKVFGVWTDPTGGLASLVTLAARLTPTYHNGELGFWSKSTNGNWTNLTQGKFGQQTAMDVFDNYVQGKFSPAAGIVRDIWKGTTYQGVATTLGTELSNQLPLVGQTYKQLTQDPNSTNALGSLILDSLGLSVNPANPPKQETWNTSSSKTLTQFHSQVGDTTFTQANQKFNQQYKDWVTKTQTSQSFKNMTPAQQSALLTKGKAIIEKNVLKSYNFTYTRSAKSTSNSNLLPQQEKANVPQKQSTLPNVRSVGRFDKKPILESNMTPTQKAQIMNGRAARQTTKDIKSDLSTSTEPRLIRPGDKAANGKPYRRIDGTT